jgi:hypothetical protein
MKYSKGVMWLDDCRIPFVEGDSTSAGKRTCNIFETEYQSGGNGSPDYFTNPLGRFTPNLLVSDDMLNDGNIIQYNKTRVDNGSYLGGHREEFVGTDNNPIKNKIKGQFFSDKGSNSRYYDLDLWFDKMLERL